MNSTSQTGYSAKPNSIGSWMPLLLTAERKSNVKSLNLLYKGLPRCVSADVLLPKLSRSQLGFINGKKPAPDSSSPDFEQWLAKDQMVMSWMLNSMDRSLAEMFSYYQSSLELWEAVREMYGNQNNSARIFQIQQDITSVHQNGQPFVQLLSKLKSLWNELEIYRPHSIDPTVLRKRKEEDQIFQLLASLGPEFEDLRSHILMNEELLSLKSVCATIQREEIRRKVMPRENPLKFIDSHACVAHPFADKVNLKISDARDTQHTVEKGFFKGKRPNLKCSYFNSMGHTIDRCWSLHPELKQNRQTMNSIGHRKIGKFKANLAATEPMNSSPMSLLNEFASFLEKRTQGGEGFLAEEGSALLSHFGGLKTRENGGLPREGDSAAFLSSFGGLSTTRGSSTRTRGEPSTRAALMSTSSNSDLSEHFNRENEEKFRDLSGHFSREDDEKFEGPSHQTEDW